MICPDPDDEVVFRAAGAPQPRHGIVVGVDPAGIASVLLDGRVHRVPFDQIVAAVSFNGVRRDAT